MLQFTVLERQKIGINRDHLGMLDVFGEGRLEENNQEMRILAFE